MAVFITVHVDLLPEGCQVVEELTPLARWNPQVVFSDHQEERGVDLVGVKHRRLFVHLL